MARLTITRMGPSPQKIDKDIKLQFLSIGEGIKELGKQVTDQMRSFIISQKKRSSGLGNLESNIDYDVMDDGKGSVSVGVGNINKLNSNAPYWRLLNYGGLSGVARQGRGVPGYFGNRRPPDPALAGTGKGNELFTHSSNAFVMFPKNPIKPFNYIEKTGAWLDTVIRVHFSGWTSRTNSFS